MSNRRRIALGWSLAITMAAVTTDVAHAQGGSPDQPKPGGGTPNLFEAMDIVVTARKKSVAERAQDVPVAINAYTEAAIEAAKVRDLADLTNLAPNTRLMPAGVVPGYGSFYIRGAGVVGTIPSNDPAVGVFVDGMPLGISAGALTEFFEIGSVEILRGPQGTLFGRNVTGGAVLINTKRPSGEFGANLRVAAGDYGQWEVGGSVEGGTAGGRIAAKLAFLSKGTSGYFRNRVDGDRLGSRMVNAVRPTLVLRPTDTIEITAMAEVGRDAGDGPIARNIFSPGTSASARYDPRSQDLGRFGVNLDTRPRNRLTWDHQVINATWDVGPGKVTSITGWRKIDQSLNTDSDGTPIPLFDYDYQVDQRQFFQEIRFAGRPFGTDAIDITIGANILDQDYSYGESRNIFNGLSRQALRGGIDHDQIGVFAQGDAKLPWNLSLTVGARYSGERKSAAIASLGNCNFARTACTIDFRGRKSWSNLSPKLGLNWQPNPNLLLYGSWTRGFRSGGYNLRNGGPGISAGPYDEESVDAYELGIKLEMLDHKLRFNAAGFYNKFSDLQFNVINQAAVNTILNAADATVKGFEVDAALAPVDQLTFTGSVGYVTNRFDRFVGLDVNGDGRATAADGTLARKLQFPSVPRWTASAAATYQAEIAGIGETTLRAAYSYAGRRAINATNSFFIPPSAAAPAGVPPVPAFLDSYHIVDLTAAVEPSRHTRVALYVKNATNERYASAGAFISVHHVQWIAPPRTWLVELSYKY